MAADQLIDYYRLRACEYDRIYEKPERQDDLALLREHLPQELAGRDILEIACGTGYWTHVCAPKARSILATDLADETLELACAKEYAFGKVRFGKADAYRLDEVQGCFDAGMAAFWWSHVPRERIPEFLQGWHRRLGSGARVVLLDNRYVEGSSTPLSHMDAAGNTYQQRLLADGTTHEVLKNFPDRDELVRYLGNSARNHQWLQLPYYWCLAYTVS
jgi:demethylmenaquinone methyltransferase/2-methoxy-6-polyprenyl-1,4-benzoquinol methylase